MSSWFQTVDQRIVYAGRSQVRLDTVLTPDGAKVEREVVVHDHAVGVVPITDDGDVILLRQYRQPVGGYVLEIPAGTLDQDGEDAEQAAVRELREEIGHEPRGRLTHLVTFLNSAGWTTEQTHLYLARGLQEATPPDSFEAQAEEADMEVVRLPVADALAEARAGRLPDAKTALGLLLAAPRLA